MHTFDEAAGNLDPLAEEARIRLHRRLPLTSLGIAQRSSPSEGRGDFAQRANRLPQNA